MGILRIRGVLATAIALGLWTVALPAHAEDAARTPVRTAMAQPPDADALVRLGRAAASRGALDQALGFYQRAVALDPRRADSLLALAGTLTDLERWDEARHAFERLL